jgi:MFS family permease
MSASGQKGHPGPAAGGREKRATLGVGFFSNGVWDMLTVIVPLHALAVGLNAAEIGLVVAARSVLPTALSIHGGIVMDELGTRRVLLWVAGLTATLPLLYPVSGWFALLVGLQLLLGLAANLAMSASQTWSLQTSHGDTAELARFSLVTRIGTFLGPVLVGAAWDVLGAWAAFACVSVWGAGAVAFAAYGKPAEAGGERSHAPPGPGRSTIAALLPRWDQHRQAIGLAAIPAVAFVLAVSFLRNTPGAVQGSLYIVYLADIGLSATIIGALFALAELSGVLGTVLAAPLERLARADRLVIACVAVSIAAIAITPLVGHALILLIAAAAVRGVAQGMSQPLMYSILGRSVPSTMHGAAVGLRHAVTRFASMLIPAGMGIAAEAWGIEASFYVIGVLLLLAAAALAVFARGALASAPTAPERHR